MVLLLSIVTAAALSILVKLASWPLSSHFSRLPTTIFSPGRPLLEGLCRN